MSWFHQHSKKEEVVKEIFLPGSERPDPAPHPEVPQTDPVSPLSADEIDELEDDIIDEVYHWVGAVKSKSPSFRSDLLHVSSLHKLCPRIAVFKEVFPDLDKKEEIEAALQMTFDFGTATHDWWQNSYFGPMGWLWGDWECSRCLSRVTNSRQPNHPCMTCKWAGWESSDTYGPAVKIVYSCKDTCRWPGGYESEDRNCSLCNRWGSWRYLEPGVYDKELGLVGHCDGICEPPTGKFQISRFALEMKTKTKDRFDSLTQPESHHVLQINTYMHYLNLKYGIIMYIHKGEYDHKKGNKPKVYFIEYDSGLVQNALKSVRDWREAEVTKKLGYRVCHSMDSWQAKKCPFYSVCYERNIDEVVERIYSEKEVENNGSNS